MKTIISTLCAAAFALAPAASGAASVAPFALAGSGSQTSLAGDFVQVQHSRRHDRDRRGADRRWQHRPGYDNRGRPQPHQPPRQESRGPDLGSAIVGAIVGGIIVNQLQQSGQYQAPRAPSVHLTRNHVDWCLNRWRSYRVSDNSYQPYTGPRRACTSPYGPL